MSRILTVARSWVGTPYVHQAAVRGAGCDCLGLLRGVWAEITGESLIPVPPYTADWSEPQGDERLWEAMAERMDRKPLAEVAPGDVLLFRMRHGAVAKHVGLQARVGENTTFIHAYHRHGVVENMFSAPWQRRLAARFAAPQHLQEEV